MKGVVVGKILLGKHGLQDVFLCGELEMECDFLMFAIVALSTVFYKLHGERRYSGWLDIYNW